MNKLNNCPVCGQPPKLSGRYEKSYSCNNPKCSYDRVLEGRTEEEARKRWNSATFIKGSISDPTHKEPIKNLEETHGYERSDISNW